MEVAFGESAHCVLSSTSAFKTRTLHRNTEDCWEWPSAAPSQHLESKPDGVDLPANTLGDTMPASGEPKGYQTCYFTGSSGNKIRFP